MIHNLEGLTALYEAERSEDDALKAREDIIHLLEQPGWRRMQDWLSRRRDDAFQQLRGVKGARDVMGESLLRWQMVDALYEDMVSFIQETVAQGTEILSRRATTANEELIKENLHGRYDPFDAASADRSSDGAESHGSSSAGDASGY